MSLNYRLKSAPTSRGESRPFVGIADTTTRTIKRRYTDFWIPTWVKFGLGGGRFIVSCETTELQISDQTRGTPNDLK